MLALQISLIILISGGLGGMLVFTDVYDDVHDTIVSTLCLSCIKLDPVSSAEFTFDTANGEEHPDFILEDLLTGPIFIDYRTDVCKACDDMSPVVKDIFGLSFEKEETLHEEVEYNGVTVNFYHINKDHASQVQEDSYDVYDKDHIGGVPMFTFITVKYNRGFIEPYYTSVYGTVGKDTFEERRDVLTNILDDCISLYETDHEGYQYP